MRRLLLCVSVLAFAVASTSRARAGVVFYGSQSAFNAATMNLTTVTFNGLAPVGGEQSVGSSLSRGGVTFSEQSGALVVVDPNEVNTPYAFESGHQVLVDNFGTGTGITVTLPDGVTAVSLLLGDSAPAGGTIILSPTLSIIFDISGSPLLDFVGFTSTSPIHSFTFQDDIQSPVIDTLRYGQTPVATPEPSTVVAAALGGLLIVTARRRRLI